MRHKKSGIIEEKTNIMNNKINFIHFNQIKTQKPLIQVK